MIFGEVMHTRMLATRPSVKAWPESYLRVLVRRKIGQLVWAQKQLVTNWAQCLQDLALDEYAFGERVKAPVRASRNLK